MPAPDFAESYVAFLDILGFSEIVNRAVNNSAANDLARLYKCHQMAAGLIAGDPKFNVVQFSDSVVISRPYDKNHFTSFVKVVADYQRLLLLEGFLCRGGLSRGGHFSNGSFMMSAGLVDAYNLEKDRARYPRVVISEELLNLLGGGVSAKARLLAEDDGVTFVDFLKGGTSQKRRQLASAAERCVLGCREHPNSSVKEKGVWLASYADKSFGTLLSAQRFASPDWSRYPN